MLFVCKESVLFLIVSIMIRSNAEMLWLRNHLF